MFNTKETTLQSQFADFSVYLQLKRLNYTNKEAINHLSCTNEYLQIIIDKFN